MKTSWIEVRVPVLCGPSYTQMSQFTSKVKQTFSSLLSKCELDSHEQNSASFNWINMHISGPEN